MGAAACSGDSSASTDCMTFATTAAEMQARNNQTCVTLTLDRDTSRKPGAGVNPTSCPVATNESVQMKHPTESHT